MVACADPLHRGDAEAELTAGLVQLQTAQRLDALALRERRRERVVAPPRHRGGQACTAVRVLQREEDRGPGGTASKLGDLALHPDVADAGEVPGEAAVEGRDGVDLALGERKLLHAPERDGVRIQPQDA